MATYKTVMRLVLEYASSVWSPLASLTSINKLASPAERSIENFHRMHTRNNICMTKNSHFPYTSTYSSTPHNTNRKHNIHHTPYTHTTYFNTPQLKNPLFSTMAATQQTFPQTPTDIKNKHVPYTHIYCIYASSHKRQ